MSVHRVAETTSISLNDLKEIGSASAPCISILMPVDRAQDQSAQNPIRLKHAMKQAEEALRQWGMEAGRLVNMVEALKAAADDVRWDSQGVALYCAPEVCRAFQVDAVLPESVTVGQHFYVKPLIPLLHADQPFYVLALAQKHIRLLRCTEHTSEEVKLTDETPKTLWEDKDSDQPDHTQDNYSSGGPDVGGMKGVAFTTNTDSEDHFEYLQHFYKHVSEGVTKHLKEEAAPLVIAGVDYETAAFRRVNVYPHLVEESVHGAADGLKGGELHKRALEAVRGWFAMPLKAALARYEQFGGGERSSSHIKDIVKAAYDGRVLELVIAEGAQYMGNFNEATHDVKGHKQPVDGDEDLLNVAALQALLHGGHVFVVPAAQVPHGAPAVATFRY